MTSRLDPYRLVNYYNAQAGSGTGYFTGAPVQYGRGLGAMFAKLFRFVAPLVKRGFNVVKPHLTTAAKNIASEVVGKVARRFTNKQPRGEEDQEGSGLVVLARRGVRRPPGIRLPATKKRRVSHNRKTCKPRGRKPKRSATKKPDIFG